MSVRNLEGVPLGVVSHFVDAPAGAVMVVKSRTVTSTGCWRCRSTWVGWTSPRAASWSTRRVELRQVEVGVDHAVSGPESRARSSSDSSLPRSRARVSSRSAGICACAQGTRTAPWTIGRWAADPGAGHEGRSAAGCNSAPRMRDCPPGARAYPAGARRASRSAGRRARSWAALPGLLLVAGRYEGVDERVVELGIDRELSVGDYVLSGGELPALVVIDAVARLLPGRSATIARRRGLVRAGFLD